jgi:hemerythrin superfamily protein
MNAIDLLTKQHRQMETALESLVKAKGEARRALFDETADTLMAHVLVEERIFYPAVNAKRTEDILLESLEEHLSLKRLVADLIALSIDDEHFEPKLHVLEEQAKHHHEEEEEKLFPKVKKLLKADELEALGEELQAAELKLLAGEPRGLARTQRAVAATLA